MNEQIIATSDAPEIIITHVEGDLQVKGWDRSEIEVKANVDELAVQEEDDVVQISCQGSCALRVPEAATLRIDYVGGEARFKLLEDQLHAVRIGGLATLRSVADASLDHVMGDLFVKNVSGDLRVGQVGGNASIRLVDGDCSLEYVSGNLEARDIAGSLSASAGGDASLREIEGDCTLTRIGGDLALRDLQGDLQARAGGDCSLRLSSLEGSSYEVNAGGDLSCRLPEDPSLQLSITAPLIRIRLADETRTCQEGTCELVLGSGDAVMKLTAGGDALIDARDSSTEAGESDFTDDFSERIDKQIEAQIEAQMDAINEQLKLLNNLSASLRGVGLDPEETQEILRQAQRSGEKSSAQAQEKMRRAQEKLERKLEAARRRSELKAMAAERRAQAAERRAEIGKRRAWTFSFKSTPKTQQPPVEPVTDEERLMILRMLEQKKITIEEAEALLAALEGQE